MKSFRSRGSVLGSCLGVLAALLGGGASVLLGVCGPFTDVSDAAFCPFVLEIFTLGITTGTTPTTYDPAATVSRLQMAAFLSRSVDGVLKRGSRRAALRRFWTTKTGANLGLTTVGGAPQFLDSDGEDVWVANLFSDSISRVHGSDGRLLETWTGADNPEGVLAAMGRVFVAGSTIPGNLYRIDPSEPAGAVTTVASNLGNSPWGIAYDGSLIWTANAGGSVSMVTPGAGVPWTTTTVLAGFNHPQGILYDGKNIWVTDILAGTLLKLDGIGTVLQTVTTGTGPSIPVFDGANIWVPNVASNSISVVRASTGAVLATLTGNGLNEPSWAAFDGERVLVTNSSIAVSLWKAADLTTLGSFGVGPTAAVGACSDGVSFWLTILASNKLARF